MTTIAFRSGALAADSQMTQGDVRTTMPGLKLFLAGRYAVGFAGDLRYAPFIERWFTADCPVGDEEFCRMWDDDWDILAMDEAGKPYVCFADTLHPITQQFYAIGSGSHFALGAMHKGATAREAIAASARFDIYTNAVIEEITVHDLRKHLSQ